jgi:ABC-type multidrug transport system ATPase subunit
MSAPLAIEKACKAYGKARVFSDVSLELVPGEIFGLIGVNGAGKTTLIKSILDLATLDSGSIRIFGEPSTKPKSRAPLYYLPEKFFPSPLLTGYEFLDICLQGCEHKLDKEAAKAGALSLQLKPEMLPKSVKVYSKGTAQKLGILAALLADLPLLVLDEPMSGLDPLARSVFKQQLKAYRARGHTIFFSSHILADIQELCDRMALIHDGALRFVGTPAEFLAQFQPAGGGASMEDMFLRMILSPEAQAA